MLRKLLRKLKARKLVAKGFAAEVVDGQRGTNSRPRLMSCA
ncbi:hypothetical protein [Alicyclobacillus cycloheptanicus]|uniref:Uncharacterized protein n=1 Tax=Alicyclobacillus cycloheptanicus TaxID=1457 RepID=A0ABT9XML3_9BACL|nr:hypothetical protein [Alicyclobacillus cycloheptanicus]MDQ0190936.1 hypothetical protein [Alicyclobacillus cycloheptanicus]